ncbi:hypothetical protein M011DRAFT_378211, partial [Sporormia fimetaria CBS 119925]
MSSNLVPKVIPAKLSFLALYNPSLSSSDETVHDQIVFYYSPAASTRAGNNNGGSKDTRNLREERNKRLREVGLAQGMVGFAQSFSSGDAVDSVETEKSRIVLKELEPGWWVLASIDLTQLPAAGSADPTDGRRSAPGVEYSSREVSPPALLMQQLRRAHSVFLLHHGSSLQSLFSKLGRDRFCNILDRYWTRFASNWDVLLHGSPGLDIFRGMKLAAGGELGMGVGEEEWGSGERDVLEELARRTDGLVDLVVSRFGEPSPLQDSNRTGESRKVSAQWELNPWLGAGRHVSASDGVVFSGVGALSRRSLRDPTSRKGPPPGIPPPIVKAAEASLEKASYNVDVSTGERPPEPVTSLGDNETWMKYLTLGYGTTWGGRRSFSGQQQPLAPGSEVESTPTANLKHVEPEVDQTEEKLRLQVQRENTGYFVIGLKGSLEEEEQGGEDDAEDWNSRIPLRTIHVELVNGTAGSPEHRPFIYTFLFQQSTGSLTLGGFYRNLHTYLSPLQRSLCDNTSPGRVEDRIAAASHPYTTVPSPIRSEVNGEPIYNLVFDPRTLTIHSSVPNIPDPGALLAEG